MRMKIVMHSPVGMNERNLSKILFTIYSACVDLRSLSHPRETFLAVPEFRFYGIGTGSAPGLARQSREGANV